MTQQERFFAICARYNLPSTSFRRSTHGFTFKTRGLPILPFFEDLAAEFRIPLKNIVATDESHDDGCETCGYGKATRYTWEASL